MATQQPPMTRLPTNNNTNSNTSSNNGLGNRRLLCGGCCMTGPEHDARFQIFTMLTYLMAYFLWSVLTSLFVGYTNILMAFVPFLTISVSLANFLLAACSDPGTLVRRQTLESVSVVMDESPTYCRSCRARREVGTYHCDYCDTCVREIDHHCNVVGNCIGARNKVYFHMMLVFALFSIVFEAINLIFVIVRFASSDATSLSGFETTMWAVAALELFVSVLVLYMAGAIALGFGLVGNSITARLTRRFISMFAVSRNGISTIKTNIGRTEFRPWGLNLGWSLPERLWPVDHRMTDV